MSHVANVEVEIKDLSALRTACENLGLEFMENQQTWNWYGDYMDDWHTDEAAVSHGYDTKDFGKGLHAIKVPNSEYEIGVVKNPNGSGFRLIYDSYGSHGRAISESLGGMKLTKLNNEYTATVATRQLQKQGYRVTRTVKKGRIHLKGVQA